MEMMIETAVLKKLRQLPEAQQQEVLNFIEFLETKVGEKDVSMSKQLAIAAEALLSDYQTDEELTTFTALDGEESREFFVNNPELLAVAYGLASAAVWGAGDFSGGFASKRGNVYTVVLLSQVVGLVCLLTLALLLEGALPPARDLLFGGLAGLAGVIGLLALYTGLARGRMGVVAPMTAVLSAIIPVVVGIITEGIPPILVLVGFGLAVTAVWLLSGGGQADGIRRDELGLAFVAGLGFSLFFVFIDQVNAGVVFWPLTAARTASVPLLLLFLLNRQLPSARWQMPARSVLPIVALSGILDSGGNYFFALATQSGRLDIAAVLASLYPASTVLLARLILKETLGPRQWLGVLVALVALVLIAL